MNKIFTLKQLPTLVKNLRNKNTTIVLVGGCFDILHPGHIEFLSLARQEGDILIVLLEIDQTVKRLKGENRPVNTQVIRGQNLCQIKSVDVVIPLPPFSTDSEYFELVNLIKPDIIAVSSQDRLLDIKKK